LSLLIKNIRKLVQAGLSPEQPLKGKGLKTLAVIEDAFLLMDGTKIISFGAMSQLPAEMATKVIDASGKMVFPSWCDSHTHIVYAGSREQEFTDRIQGLTYEEIAQRGGGILNSAKRLRAASEEELMQSALFRLQEIMRQGTGAVEIKSGYGLSPESELKMLRVIKKLKTLTPLTIKSTFLGAHAIPEEYKNNKTGYIEILIKEMIPAVAAEKLADYCDVFCERGYFDQRDTEQILSVAKDHGMIGKVHANQLSYSGGVQAGVNSKAISVDHLEYVGDEEIAALLSSDTIPTILPGAQWFLQLPFPPARKMIDAGLPLAIATDYNPGSCPSGNMNMMISLACVQYKMTPEEAINAATVNGAFAMGLGSSHGAIAPGRQASVFITKPIPDYSFLPYSFANNLIETTIVNGEVTWQNRT
jgi:imidazolonepropionase